MNCGAWEELVALDASGDLSEADVTRVAGHLRDCGNCRLLAAELRADREALAGLRDEDLDAAAAVVRSRVMQRVAAGRRVWWYAAAAAVLIAGFGLGMLTRSEAPAVARREAAPVRKIEEPVRETVAPVRIQPAVQVRKRAPRAPSQPMLVKMLTDRDDIVIYWIVEGKGELE